MLVPIERLLGIPILSLQTGAELARTAGTIIDPRQLKIVALRVNGKHLDDRNSVLHPEDIREISDIGIIIDSSDELMSLDGLVRLQKIIDFGFELPGIRVEDEAKRKLGVVKSYALDPESFVIQQLYVKPSFIQSLNVTVLTIHRSQIVTIDNSKIVVKAPREKKVAPLEQTVQNSFANPFRTPTPTQPEGRELGS